MGIFDDIQHYAEGYQVKEVKTFSGKDREMVVDAVVKKSTYGYSVCFFMKGGYKCYIPVSRDSVAVEEQKVDLDKAKVIILSKAGSDDIKRVVL